MHCAYCGDILNTDYLKIKGLNPTHFTPANHKISDEIKICRKCFVAPNRIFLHDDILLQRDSFINELINLSIQINKNFPVSSSRQNYFEEFDHNLHMNPADRNLHMQMTGRLLRVYGNDFYNNEINTIKSIEKRYSHCLKVGIANCHEMALFCFLHFYYKIKKIYLFCNLTCNIFVANDADHVFFCVSKKDLFGRIIKIVCDPWYKSVFLLKNLSNYYNINDISDILNYEAVKNLGSTYSKLEEIPPRSAFSF